MAKQYALKAVKKGVKKLAEKAAGKSAETVKREEKVKPPQAPAVHGAGPGGPEGPLIQKIYETAEQNRDPRALYEAELEKLAAGEGEPVFGPADPELTKQLVPQYSLKHHLPPYDENVPFPANDRARPIWENRHALAKILADDLSLIDEPIPFYSTGSVLTGLTDKTPLGMAGAQSFMRDWSGQGAGTSTRTKTPQNLRNASFLQYRRAAGDPLTPEVQRAEQAAGLWGSDPKTGKNNLNRPGFAMMEGHTRLSDEFARDVVDPWRNPKPYLFQEAWSGNMGDVVADQHNILAVLDAYDRLDPGGLPREWFMSDAAYQSYRESGGLPKQIPDKMFEGSLAGGVVPGTGGREAQTEYPLIAEPTYLAADLMGISPSEAQENLWFAKGGLTGLRSPPRAIPDLLNAQIQATARATGLHPEVIMKLWATRKIPLAQDEQPVEDWMTATG